MAKENIVATFGILYGINDSAAGGSADWTTLSQNFTALTAYSFMMFNLLCAPCFAAMGAIKREMNDSRWTAAAISYLCIYAYTVCLIVNQIGRLFMGESFGVWTVIAFILLAGLIYLITRKNPYNIKKESR